MSACHRHTDTSHDRHRCPPPEAARLRHAARTPALLTESSLPPFCQQRRRRRRPLRLQPDGLHCNWMRTVGTENETVTCARATRSPHVAPQNLNHWVPPLQLSLLHRAPPRRILPRPRRAAPRPGRAAASGSSSRPPSRAAAPPPAAGRCSLLLPAPTCWTPPLALRLLDRCA